MNARKRQKVVLIEPSAIVTEGLKQLLAAGGTEFEITAAFPDLVHFDERVHVLEADLIVVNPAVFDFRKRFSVRHAFSGLPDAVLVAMICGFTEPEALKQYQGSIHLYDDGPTLVRKLRQALESRPSGSETSDNYELSDRENEILIAVAKGMTNKEIADLHHISVHTVISHRKNITRKTGIKTVSGLTVYALLNGLLDQSEIE